MVINRIKEVITALKINQTTFARQIGVDPAALSNVMRRKRGLGDGIVARIIARAGVSEKWLLTGEGEMFESPKQPEPTPREFALSKGCGSLAADIFAGYCELSAADKRIFEGVLEKFIACHLPISPDSASPAAGLIVANATADRGGVVNQNFK